MYTKKHGLINILLVDSFSAYIYIVNVATISQSSDLDMYNSGHHDHYLDVYVYIHPSQTVVVCLKKTNKQTVVVL